MISIHFEDVEPTVKQIWTPNYFGKCESFIGFPVN